MSDDAIIAGIDEAGRGCLAGPVVAGACVMQKVPKKILIADSKLLTLEQRDEAFDFITQNFSYGIGVVEASVVDEIGILGATEKAMHMALEELQKKITPTYLLIDGRDHFWFDIPHSSIIRGDQLEPCISAASILAKVTRDRLMVEYEEEFSGYGFAQHKGYGTAQHRQMIQKLGLCPLHRRTFLRTLGTDKLKTARAFSR